MNGGSGTISEKLGLGPEVREMKFGSSFSNSKSGKAFHTIRYDFKPASIDKSKMASMDIGENSQVTITMPHSDANGATVFKGGRKPHGKECVLIVDHETGEITLEKLSDNVQVKKTRQERPERPEGVTRGMPNKSNSSMPTIPNIVPQHHQVQNYSDMNMDKESNRNLKMEKEEKSDKSSKEAKNKNNNNKSTSSSSSSTLSVPFGGGRRPHSPMVPQKHSPLNPSPGRISPNNGNNNNNNNSSVDPFDHLINNYTANNAKMSSSSSNHFNSHHQQQPPQTLNSTLPSLNSIEDLLMMGEPFNSNSSVNNKPPTPQAIYKPSKTAQKSTELSESSSGSSSSSSSSSEGESSDDDEMETVDDIHIPIIPSTLNLKPNHSQPHPSKNLNKPISPPMAHLLSEDLQLSESGSDSD